MKSQLSLELYKEKEIDRVTKPGQIILVKETLHKKEKGFFKMYKRIIPKLVIKENEKVSYNWHKKFHYGESPLIRTGDINYRIKSHNWSVKDNRYSKKDPHYEFITFLDRATSKNTKVGDRLIKISKIRTTFKQETSEYDGEMKLTGYFILPEWFDETKF